ncbi:MAG: gfo/Idh/MocA family oxidoreductase, partial [Verrucomicrobiae bacterium]|nr:gfo/Idh/MocA family oxidoreductase [Verrucomicrobiae bacterium]
PGMGDVEWQLRNWYNFVWTCGDGLVEQGCHTLDKIMWAMKDEPPLKCVAVGGRQTPNPGGNIYDHIEVNYVWPNGTRAFFGHRQLPKCFNKVADYVMGTKGVGTIGEEPQPTITGETNWTYTGENNDMYQTEHDEFFASIRKGEPINDGVWMATSTMASYMGRMAAYTGQEISWEQALNSKEQLVPDKLDWNQPLPVAPMAEPGKTKFI